MSQGIAPAYDEDFPPLRATPTDASHSVIDLQQETTRRSTPTIPPGLESVVQSRHGTPTIPPGLSKEKPTALPDLESLGSRPSSRASLRRAVSSQVVPVLPLRPGTPAKNVSRPGTPARGVSRAASPTRKVTTTEAQVTPTKKGKGVVEAKQPSEPVANIGAEQDSSIPDKQQELPKPKGKAKEQEKDLKTVETQQKKPKPAAPGPKEASIEPPTAPLLHSTPTQSASKGPSTSQAGDAKGILASSKKADNHADSSKRKHPGKLDITAAVKQAEEASIVASKAVADENENTSGSKRVVSQTPSTVSVPASPSASSLASPGVKSGPRTLRVVQTPKTDTVGQVPPTSSAMSTPGVGASIKYPSRQPSVASINLPGTPSSEQVSVSDNVSITSTSQSRANSPPPPGAGKVGSAPVRAKTKSQMKKERQERAKVLEEEKSRVEEVIKPTSTEDTAQEAIVSRKKKTKKEKEPKPKPKTVQKEVEVEADDLTPTASRPESAGKAVVQEVVKVEEKPSTLVKQAPVVAPEEPPAPQTPTVSPANLVAELKLADMKVNKAIEGLFRVPSANNAKPTQPITSKDLEDPPSWRAPDFNIKLSKQDVSDLLTGKAAALGWGGAEGRIWSRTMITPGGAQIRGLTEDVEKRFLELEKHVLDLPEELRFRPTKPQNETRFPAFDLRALKRGFDAKGARGVSVMEQMVQDGSAMKKGAFLVDEASKYINEFVMPPATPPPNAGRAAGGSGQHGVAVQGSHTGATQTGAAVPGPHEVSLPSVEVAEKHLQEAKRVVDEREGTLRRVIRKNRKLLGLG